jgi:hypothetical protein
MLEIKFRLDEVARFVRCPAQHVRDLVAAGIVVPIVRGGKGRGQSHIFDGRQAVGLAVVVAFQRGIGDVRRAYASKVFTAYQAQPLEVFLAWVCQQTGLPVTFGPRTAEAKAAWLGGPVWQFADALAADPFDPCTAEEVKKDIKRSWLRIAQAAVKQLAQARGAGRVPDADDPERPATKQKKKKKI